MPPERRNDDLSLDRFWDDMVLGQPLHSEGIDPLDAVTIGRLYDAELSRIDPNFRRRLRRDLLRGSEPTYVRAAVAGDLGHQRERSDRRWAASAAALLVMAGLVALGLLLRWGRTPEQIVTVPALEIPATPDSTPEAAPQAAIATPLWRFTDARDPERGIAPGITAAPDGAIWIVDGATSGFQIFSPEGQLIGHWGIAGEDDGEFTFAAGDSNVVGAVAFRSDGGFYVADSGNARVQQFTSSREFVRSWSGEGQGDGQFSRPIDVDVDAQGNVYIIDADRDEIQKFDADGSFLLSYGGSGSESGQFQDIAWGTLDAEGNFWVADPGNDRIQQFTADGAFLREIGPDIGTVTAGGVQLDGPQAVAFDAAGSIFIADPGNARIVVLSPEGVPIGAFGEDMLDAPMALAIDNAGDLIVIDGGRRSALQAFHLALPEFAPP